MAEFPRGFCRFDNWCFGWSDSLCSYLLLLNPAAKYAETLKKTARDVPSKVSEVLDDSLDLYASAINYCQLVVEEQSHRIKKAVAAGKMAAAKRREELELGGNSVLPFQHR